MLVTEAMSPEESLEPWPDGCGTRRAMTCTGPVGPSLREGVNPERMDGLEADACAVEAHTR